MNPLNINHIKLEKANSIKLRYQKLRKFTNFFRVFEIFLVFAVISRVSLQLPLTIFNILNQYFNNISFFLGSPQFVFIVGNIIVITLFINHGNFYNNMNKSSKNSTNVATKNMKLKHKNNINNNGIINDENTIMATIFSTPEHQVIKIYHRSNSEKVIRRGEMEPKCCNLRRSNTDVKRVKKSCNCSKHVKENNEGHYPEDHMSNEEFRKTIENFIAKQQRFLREEEEDFMGF
ncbi:hypothetical protein RND81_14G250700 [Saponaria officinalis]|uniref:DUF4408 domain-containing protein n=1 Tax=Saponaria officinalis TaxID=3572 RepID=A0AAW1GUC0_SAPOF